MPSARSLKRSRFSITTGSSAGSDFSSSSWDCVGKIVAAAVIGVWLGPRSLVSRAVSPGLPEAPHPGMEQAVGVVVRTDRIEPREVGVAHEPRRARGEVLVG